MMMQFFLVDVDGWKVFVDICVGNDKVWCFCEWN